MKGYINGYGRFVAAAAALFFAGQAGAVAVPPDVSGVAAGAVSGDLAVLVWLPLLVVLLGCALWLLVLIALQHLRHRAASAPRVAQPVLRRRRAPPVRDRGCRSTALRGHV